MSEEKKKASKILERFTQAKSQRSSKDEKWKELDAFDRGEQWDLDGAQIPKWVPRPVTNFIHLVKYTKRAALAIKNPVGQLMPEGPEDQELVRKFQRIYDHTWRKMRARMTVREAIETAKLLGTAIVQVYYDNDEEVKGSKGARYQGEVKAEQVDPASFFPDPNAFSLKECEFVHVVKRKPVSWLKKTFKDKADDIEASHKAGQDQGEIYQRDYESNTGDRIVDYHAHYEKVPNDEGTFNYKVTYLAGDVFLEERELRPNRYPFAILYDFPQRQDFWALSTCEMILDNQKLINKVESVIALIGTLLQNPQKIVNKRSGIDPKEATIYGSAPGHTFVSNGDPTRAIHWAQPPQIPQSLLQLVEHAKQNIREVTGLTEAYTGQSVGSLQTSSGVDSLIERSTMRDQDQMYDVELFVEDLSNLMLSFITEFYDEERYVRIMGDTKNQVEFEKFVGTDFKDLEFDMFVDVSAQAPISRTRQKEEAEKLLNMQGQYQFDPPIYTPQEYMQHGDHIRKEEIIDRMNKDEIMSAEAILSDVTQMATEALTNGLPPEEVGEAAQQMLMQKFEAKQTGTGNVAGGENQGAMQMRQGQAQTV